jgi:phage/plasmid-like protein (TIGR03299 family)
MAYDTATPWHGLGERVGEGATVDMALDAAQLRYTVAKAPIFLADGTKVEDFQAIMRQLPGQPDHFLSVVGKGYQPIQGERACDILRPMVDMGCSIGVAGALGDGERAWMLAKMPGDGIDVLGVDKVRGYFLLHWSHDGNSGIVGQFTGIRVVCQNTLAMAERAGKGRKGNTFNIRHTSSADARVDEAAAIMAQLTETLRTTGETFEAMAHRALGPAEVKAYIECCIPNPEPRKSLSPVLQARRDAIERLLTIGKGVDLANSAVEDGQVSLWAAYNGITEYFDHVRTAETKSPEGLRRAQESAIFGGNAETKALALNVAQQLLAGA